MPYTASNFQNTDLEAIWEAIVSGITINNGVVTTTGNEKIATEKMQIITGVEVLSSLIANLKSDINANITTNPTRKYINITSLVVGANVITVMPYTT